MRHVLTAILLVSCLCLAPARASDTTDAVAAAQTAAAAASTALEAAKAAALSASAAASAAPAQPVLAYVPELTLWFVLAMFVIGVGVPIRKLSRDASGWSLTDALSEKNPSPAPVAIVQAAVAVVPGDAAPAAAAPPVDPGSSASASRLVAFLGTIAILAMFMGFGLYAIWAAFNGRAAEARDTLKAMSSYLLYGSAMYAPYAFNQIKAAFSS